MLTREIACAALLSACAAPGAVPLRAGFAVADITPDPAAGDVFIAGFGQDRRATGVHDPLLASAVVLEAEGLRVALVSADLIGLFRDSVLRARARLPEIDYLLVSSTHGHEGPDTLGLWGPNAWTSGVDPDYLARVEDAIAEAVLAAAARLEPVRAAYGAAQDPALIHDGRLPQAADAELRALSFRRPDGSEVGVLVQWTCHPETLGSRNTLVSADFPHFARARLAELRGAPVAYFNGAVGGMMTSLDLEVRDAAGHVLPERSFEKTARYGDLVAELAQRALADAEPIELAPFEIRARVLRLPLQNPAYAVARAAGVLRRQGFPREEGGVAVETEVAVLRLGELTLVAVPGELYPELLVGGMQDPQDPAADFQGAPAEPVLFDLVPGPRLCFGLANDELGYLIPKSQWDVHEPYCYGRSESQYGEVNSLGPETAPLVVGALAELLSESERAAQGSRSGP